MSLTRTVDLRLRDFLAQRAELSVADLEQMLRLLAKWRHQLVTNTLVARDGATAMAGPFQGMKVGEVSSEGCHAPRILGCYEHELHATLERLIARGFGTVLNVGCAGGYYAIGLALRLPRARVLAHDTDLAAQALCRTLAEANDVAARIEIGGEIAGADFARVPAGDTLVVMDIEGGEVDLLDPAAFPALRGLTIVVECHDGLRRGASAEIARRFAASHRVTRIEHSLATPEMPAWLRELGHLDQLLATWEWRAAPTPWLVLEP